MVYVSGTWRQLLYKLVHVMRNSSSAWVLTAFNYNSLNLIPQAQNASCLGPCSCSQDEGEELAQLHRWTGVQQ
jgi:hypothetical protein